MLKNELYYDLHLKATKTVRGVLVCKLITFFSFLSPPLQTRKSHCILKGTLRF